MNDEVASPPTILLVDDEPSILSALRRLLRPQGYKILMAEGGAAGLALMALEPVDLVVSDMRMPEMDGVQFLEQVREGWPGTVRILLTGYADISSTIAAINRGAIHRYISKPWDDNDILLAIGDGLQRHKLEQENQRLAQLTQVQNEQLQDMNMQLQDSNAQLHSVNDQLQDANGQLASVNQELQDSNGQLGKANEQLAGVNEELEKRVQERTQELQQAHDELSRSHAEMALAHEKLQQAHLQLEENFALSISVFAGLLELRDGSVSGHGRRVATLAGRIAEAMNLGPAEVLDIHNAGLLHEVGKIGLPDELLRKTVSLMSGSEFELYKRHPLQAQAALMPLARLHQSALLIRSQHERIDGKGYPDGLTGIEVPLGSQIINIASTFESLIAGRLAEKVFSTDDACKAIHENGEQHYDPEVLAAFDAVQAALALESAADQELSASELRGGMVLARDLLSPHGSLLLPAGHVFSSALIKQVQLMDQRERLSLSFFIKKPQDPRQAAKKAQHA
ncbi:HD domain-containing phosphohydrolase [Paucibacter sp. DJ2R-2]|uniref:HD domain-containing phosphohydrolase n=1 Tax=Paucibacter sp. DJ2R-2 TaxID=2893558 RepID=UPI0021E37F9A|nr:HD domain-containing phosphohydrolase [Paucibacter sp. DJ2R-2]MCV2419764.1 response regulator [Paucibacter sp. DJ4R-1]MCV2437333.1 response regulator [Paucibacter sp. DJ2R-2]